MELPPMGRCLSAILIWVWSVASFAYPTPVDFGGDLIRWDIGIENPDVTYTVEADNDYDVANYFAFVDEASYLWSVVPTAYVNLRRAAQDEKANITIKFQNTISGASFSSGFAVFDEVDEEGKPVHCSIFIVATDFILSLQKTILHEIGHCMGLGHTLVPEAIMSYSLDKNGYRLDTDDRAALTRLYPADGSEPQLPPGCSTPFWLHQGKKIPFAIYLFLLLPLVIPLIQKQKKGGLKTSQK